MSVEHRSHHHHRAPEGYRRHPVAAADESARSESRRSADRGSARAADAPYTGRSVSRRSVLHATGVAVATSLAGCSDGGNVPEPISLTTEHTCDVCGMVIPNHPGPSTQIFYPDRSPSGHENPARFDSTWEAFQYDFERRDRGWSASVVYVTDYSTVEYTIETAGGDSLISTHPSASAFLDASEVTFVVGSAVKGAMGRDLIAFSANADASAFADEHGGSLRSLDEVTETTIAQLRQS